MMIPHNRHNTCQLTEDRNGDLKHNLIPRNIFSANNISIRSILKRIIIKGYSVTKSVEETKHDAVFIRSIIYYSGFELRYKITIRDGIRMYALSYHF